MISTFALFLCLENKRVKDTKERRRILLTDYRLCESKDFGRSLRIEPGEKQPCNGRNDVDASWKCESKDSNRSDQSLVLIRLKRQTMYLKSGRCVL